MSTLSTTLSGIDQVVALSIVVIILIALVVGTLLLSWTGVLGKTMNSLEKGTYKGAVLKELEKIEEIAEKHPNEKVRRVARNFLDEWESEIKPSLSRMSHNKRANKLKSVRSSILPILEYYEEI